MCVYTYIACMLYLKKLVVRELVIVAWSGLWIISFLMSPLHFIFSQYSDIGDITKDDKTVHADHSESLCCQI